MISFPSFLYYAVLFYLFFFLLPPRGIFSYLGLFLLLLLLWWPLQFSWDLRRGLGWNRNHLFFLLQTISLPLSLLSFYLGLQGPLALENLSGWSQGKQMLLILGYVFLLKAYFLPKPLVLPGTKDSSEESYAYGPCLLAFLRSFPGGSWSLPFNKLLELLESHPRLRPVHSRLDFLLRVLLPLAFPVISLLGLWLQKDLSWMLRAQLLQLLSWVYVQLHYLLLEVLRSNLRDLGKIIRPELLPGALPPLMSRDIIFYWQPQTPPLGAQALKELSLFWLFALELEDLFLSWNGRLSLDLLRALRLLLALVLWDPLSSLSGEWDNFSLLHLISSPLGQAL